MGPCSSPGWKSYVNKVDRFIDQTEKRAFILVLIDLCLVLRVSRVGLLQFK